MLASTLASRLISDSCGSEHPYSHVCSHVHHGTVADGDGRHSGCPGRGSRGPEPSSVERLEGLRSHTVETFYMEVALHAMAIQMRGCV